MTPAGHLLSGYLVGEFVAAASPAGTPRRWVVGAALLGSITPDFDVLFGVFGGWAGAGAHRGVTHSFLWALFVAGAVALAGRGYRWRLSVAAFAGVLTHIFWDWLNYWGVRPLWPWMKSFRGNLLHEGDLYTTAILLAASVLLWKNRRRAAVVTLAAVLPAYLLVQLWWRDHTRELAAAELAGRRAAVCPTSRLRCGWIALSAGESDMSVHCVSSPLAPRLRLVRSVATRDDFFTRASEQSPVVREFREKIAFPFADVEPAENGGALVMWRDLRVAYEEDPAAAPAGLRVRLDAAGRILSERHRWKLSLW